MRYKDNTFWIYVEHDDVSRKTDITGRTFDSEWLQIAADGTITVKGTNPNACGYAWDGCSPKWAFLDQVWGIPDGTIDPITEKRKTYYASMFHDALYQQGTEAGVKRKEEDRLFLDIMKESGFLWSYFYFFAVRAVGWLFYNRGS